MMNGMMGGGMWFWALAWLLFAALLVIGIVVLVRSLGGVGAGTKSTRSAMQILEERFARGEIDRDEFEERRRTLES